MFESFFALFPQPHFDDTTHTMVSDHEAGNRLTRLIPDLGLSGQPPCTALPRLLICDIGTTLTHSTWQALPWLNCLALDTEQTAATLCA